MDNNKDRNSTLVGTVGAHDATGTMVNAMQRFSLKIDELNSTAIPAQLKATKNRMMGCRR